MEGTEHPDFRALFEQALSAVVITDDEGHLLEANPAAARLLGVPREDLKGRRADEFVAPGYDAEGRRARLHRDGSQVGVIRIRRPDGSTRDAHYTATAGFEPGKNMSILQDVTERLALERELSSALDRERALRTKILDAQEQERRRIALDLHDDIVQVLTALQLRIGLLERAGVDEAVVGGLEGQIADAIVRARHLMFSMHPRMLDEAEVGDVLAVLVDGWTEMPATTFDDQVSASLPEDTRYALFRIAREALSNIRRHAGATHAAVRVALDGDAVEMTISDDGRGCDLFSAGELHVGVASMRERAQTLGGTFDLESAPGLGTRVCVRLPLERRLVRAS